MWILVLVIFIIRLSWENEKAKMKDAEMETWARSNHLSGYHDHNGNWIEF